MPSPSEGFSMKTSITLLFLTLSCFSQSQDQLKKSLKKKISHKSKFTYKEARRILLGHIHLQGSSKKPRIKDLYCNKLFSNKDIKSRNKIAKGRIPDHKIVNTEHVWPKSKFFKRRPRGKYKRHAKSEYQTRLTDLHILYPSSTYLNEERSSYKFGEVLDKDKFTKKYDCSEAQLGLAKLGNKKSKDLFFEPPTISKGNVARAMFYFSIRYKRSISHWEETFLRKWHELDPPDSEEKRRNDLIEKFQGNRNPFIDDPKLVRAIKDF